MDAATQHGYLLLADISGYTSFLVGTELDHAHEILIDLPVVMAEATQCVFCDLRPRSGCRE